MKKVTKRVIVLLLTIVGILSLALLGGCQNSPNGSFSGGNSSDLPSGNYSEGLEFTLNDDGESYFVSGIGTCTDTNIVIPSTYNLKPVTSIGALAFYSCTELTNVIIPDSVTSIGLSAFSYCSGLTSLTIPNSVISISESVFSSCTGLESITVDSKNTTYHSENNCLIETATKTLILGCKNSVIPSDGSITSIGYRAFEDCAGLTSVTIPDSVTSIGERAFFWCRGLTSLTIPDSVTSIGMDAFCHCYKLVEVINKSSLNIEKNSWDNGGVGAYALAVHNGESVIDNRDGYLFITDNGVNYLLGYTGDDTDLVLPDNYNGENYGINIYAFSSCSGLTSVTIPDSVTSIGEYAFSYCSGLTSVTIPNGVTSIGDGAFFGCSGLTSITMPNSVTSIGYRAFDDCTKLNEIKFNGTMAEWNLTRKGEDWHSDVPATQVICSDGNVDL